MFVKRISDENGQLENKFTAYFNKPLPIGGIIIMKILKQQREQKLFEVFENMQNFDEGTPEHDALLKKYMRLIKNSRIQQARLRVIGYESEKITTKKGEIRKYLTLMELA